MGEQWVWLQPREGRRVRGAVGHRGDHGGAPADPVAGQATVQVWGEGGRTSDFPSAAARLVRGAGSRGSSGSGWSRCYWPAGWRARSRRAPAAHQGYEMLSWICTIRTVTFHIFLASKKVVDQFSCESSMDGYIFTRQKGFSINLHNQIIKLKFRK